MKLKEFIAELEKLDAAECELVISEAEGGRLQLARPTIKMVFSTSSAQTKKFVAIEMEESPDIIEQVVYRNVSRKKLPSMWPGEED